ncbi:hypothetical protein MYRNA_228 [Mycobacterium phage Myrna]|uniref:Uncharacterized protein n=1 Tax=Mycobacterium phage Myrna TaxID=546805 RepID=B5LJJ8_9CAUD|nr:gp228 [Mycobacterium phage Myrna]ACH62195.1 hypothetical protein MYRNA_228 [Mycobacterium phage Myrna]
MNKKRKYKSDTKVEFLHEVEIKSGSKTYKLVKGMAVSVNRKPGLLPGKYEFLYAEESKDGTLVLTVEGKLSQAWEDRRRRTIRVEDIKQVHIKTRPSTD